MRLKRILIAVFAAMFVLQLMPHATLGETLEDETQSRTYRYVALGGSNTSGFNLPGADQKPHGAWVVTEELIADPVTNAYPALFGNELKGLGEKYGCATSATNLGATSYTAQDVERTIREEGYMGVYASQSYDNKLPARYHDIFCKYLSDADMVSILLGGNDMRMGTLSDADQNPIVLAIGTSTSKLFVGRPKKEALEAGKRVLQEHAEQITYATMYDAANTMAQMADDVGADAKDAAERVEGVIRAVEELNPRARIALLGLFDPFHDCPEVLEGFQSDLEEIVFELFVTAESYISEGSGTQGAESIGSQIATSISHSK